MCISTFSAPEYSSTSLIFPPLFVSRVARPHFSRTRRRRLLVTPSLSLSLSASPSLSLRLSLSGNPVVCSKHVNITRIHPDHARLQPGPSGRRGGLRAPGGPRGEAGQAGQDHLARHAQAGVRHPAARQRHRGGHQEDQPGLLEEKAEPEGPVRRAIEGRKGGRPGGGGGGRDIYRRYFSCVPLRAGPYVGFVLCWLRWCACLPCVVNILRFITPFRSIDCGTYSPGLAVFRFGDEFLWLVFCGVLLCCCR